MKYAWWILYQLRCKGICYLIIKTNVSGNIVIHNISRIYVQMTICGWHWGNSSFTCSMYEAWNTIQQQIFCTSSSTSHLISMQNMDRRAEVKTHFLVVVSKWICLRCISWMVPEWLNFNVLALEPRLCWNRERATVVVVHSVWNNNKLCFVGIGVLGYFNTYLHLSHR